MLEEAHKVQQYSNVDYLNYVIKLCLQNRDIKHGKGLTETTYMMLNTIVYYCYEKEVFPEGTVIKILKSFVENKYDLLDLSLKKFIKINKINTPSTVIKISSMNGKNLFLSSIKFK